VIALEKRPEPSKIWSFATPLLAVVLTMIVGGLLFASLGKNPAETIRTIFLDPLFSEFAWFYRPQLLVKGAPLALIAIGLSFGFRAGVWNIGAEGQYILGTIFAAAVGLAFYPIEARWLIFPLMILAGALGGFLWAMIPGILRVRFGTNEILVSLMLVYVAEQLLASMALGPLRNPDGMGFPGSRNLAQYPSAANLEIVVGSGMHWGVLTGFVAIIYAYIMFSRHIFGFQVRLAGQAPRAAKFAGVNPSRMILICLGLSGALAGLAGMFEVAGPSGQVSIDFNVGYGFTAIIVAFLGRLHPIGGRCSHQLPDQVEKRGNGMKHSHLPYLMGAIMGPMMLWMLHDSLMSGAALSFAAVGFILAHVAVLVGFALLAWLGIRLRPSLAKRLHRPSLAHIGKMLAGAAIAALTLHLLVHSGVLTWT